MNTQEIRKMSKIERLQAREALWDSLIDEESEIRSPEWHRDMLEDLAGGESRFSTYREEE